MGERRVLETRAQAIGYVLCRDVRYGVPPYNWPHRWFLCHRGRHDHTGSGLLTLEQVEEKIDLMQADLRSPAGERLALLKGLGEMLRRGRQRGILTYEEANDLLPDSRIRGEEIDEILYILDDLRIELVDAKDLQAEKQGPEPQTSDTRAVSKDAVSRAERPEPGPRTTQWTRATERLEDLQGRALTAQQVRDLVSEELDPLPEPGSVPSHHATLGSHGIRTVRSEGPGDVAGAGPVSALLGNEKPAGVRRRSTRYGAVISLRECLAVAGVALFVCGWSLGGSFWPAPLTFAAGAALLLLCLMPPSRSAANHKERSRQ